MSKLYVTDNQTSYIQSSFEFKILLGNGLILASSFLTEKELENFNSELNALEAIAAEMMIEELNEIVGKSPEFKVNPFISTLLKKEKIAYTQLYPNFKRFVIPKNQLTLILQKFVATFLNFKITQINLYLSEKYSLIEKSTFETVAHVEIEIYSSTQNQKIPFYKNILFFLYSIFKPVKVKLPSKNKKHILLVLFDTFNDLDLFHTFFQLVNDSTDVHLSIIQIKSGIEQSQSCSIDHLSSPNISCYSIEEFRSYVRYSNSDFYTKAKNINPKYAVFEKIGLNENLEIYSSYFNKIIKKLKPDVCMYDNTGEIGRSLADVSRYYSIPSVNVEYGMFTDDAIHMESRIQYTHRVCLGQAGIDVWRNRNDPSLNHHAIGFLKLDRLKKLELDKTLFFDKNNLDSAKKTLFFASTWGGTNDLYNEEKKVIVQHIAELAIEKNWNFIVKKHPAETDTFVEEALKLLNAQSIRVFKHGEISLYEALAYSDFVITQNSSISVEALYFEKPTIFYNLSAENSLFDQLTMKNESFVFNIHSKEQLLTTFDYISKNEAEIKSDINKSKEKYLFKTDGKSSERLLDLLKNC